MAQAYSTESVCLLYQAQYECGHWHWQMRVLTVLGLWAGAALTAGVPVSRSVSAARRSHGFLSSRPFAIASL
jgi:hypothetical protein